MRLIDADALLENYNLKNMHKYNTDGSLSREATNTLMLYEIADMIEDTPTAYDVDKVVKELENLKTVKPMGSIASTKKVTSETIRVVDMVIDTVKRGGTNVSKTNII